MKEANAHSHDDLNVNKKDIVINFSQKVDYDCENSLYDVKEGHGPKPWTPQVLANETTITARIGPTGGMRGYTPITGIPSWGIAWYLNDKLIPELYVERGRTYTFVVEGGDDKTQPARYHPFYITDSVEGGFGQSNDEQQSEETVYAGIERDEDGYPYPTAGKLAISHIDAMMRCVDY